MQIRFLSRCLYHCSSYLHPNCDCDNRQEHGVSPAEDACDSGGPKGGTPYVRQDGGHHRWPGPGGILWICLTLVRGVPEATGIRTAALAKDCMATKKQGSSHLMTFIYSAGASVPHVRRLLGCHLRLFRTQWQCEDDSRTLPQSTSSMTLPFVVGPIASTLTS